MKKFLIVLLFSSLLLIGCDNKEEIVKNDYLMFKSKLLSNDKFMDSQDINFSIVVKIDRINEEEISYEMIISNPSFNMYKIKALLVHNYYTEDIFPSIGIFDDEVDYLKGSSNELILKGYIKTDKDIDNLDLELKLYFSYIDDFGNRKDIYYKTTK